VFILYDDVAYDKNGWRNRNRIKSSHGMQWLTVPVSFSLSEHTLVKDVKIDNKINWRKKHLLSIKQNYSKTQFYPQYSEWLEKIFEKDWNFLIDLDMHFITGLSEHLGLIRELRFSSQMKATGDKIGRLVELCREVGADTFYEGAAGTSYINPDEFLAQGITVLFQNYKHPVYRQCYGEFIPYLSVLDLLLNEGADSLKIITENQ
jgi:hypothetical protein